MMPCAARAPPGCVSGCERMWPGGSRAAVADPTWSTMMRNVRMRSTEAMSAASGRAAATTPASPPERSGHGLPLPLPRWPCHLAGAGKGLACGGLSGGGLPSLAALPHRCRSISSSGSAPPAPSCRSAPPGCGASPSTSTATALQAVRRRHCRCCLSGSSAHTRLATPAAALTAASDRKAKRQPSMPRGRCAPAGGQPGPARVGMAWQQARAHKPTAGGPGSGAAHPCWWRTAPPACRPAQPSGTACQRRGLAAPTETGRR